MAHFNTATYSLQYGGVFHGEHTRAYPAAMASIAEILQSLIDSMEGMNPTQLAAKTGVPQPTIYRILTGESKDPETKTLQPIADFFGKAVAQLRGEIPIEVSNVVDPETPITRLPLISWVVAGTPREVNDPYALGAAESWEPFTGKYSGQAYCVRVKGDSMVRPDGTGFPEGTIIAIEPNRPAAHKDFVIVRFANSDEATFKQLIIDGPFKFLKPLNPEYRTVEVPNDAQLRGVVREATLTQRFF